jgi:hypothetical protein
MKRVNSSSPPRARWHLAFALVVILFGAHVFLEARTADLLHTYITYGGTRPPISPLAGYTAGVLFLGSGVALLIRWIHLVRRPPDE